MAMAIPIAREQRTPRVVTMAPEKRRVQRMGSGMGMGREMVKGKVFLNKPQGEVISLVPLLCSSGRKYMRQNQTQRANQSGYVLTWKHQPPSQFGQMMKQS